MVYPANEERVVHSGRAEQFDGRNSLNSKAGWVANSAALVDVGTRGPASHGVHTAAAQRESATVSAEESSFTETSRKDLQEGLIAFFEQEDTSRLGVIEYSKASASLISLRFRLITVLFQYRTLVMHHLDNSGLGVNERLKLLLLSVVEEKDTMDGVMYCDAVGEAGSYPVVFIL